MPWETLGAPSAIFDLPGNKECADCKAYGPNWASWNLGILVCTTCSGVHRHLGVHISKVKSATMDKWKEDQAVACLTIGNERSNAYYEYNVPAGAKYLCKSQVAAGDKIDPVEARKMERWIRAKYETKKYAQPGVDPPHVRLARGESLTGGAEAQAKQEKTEEVDASPLSEKSDQDRKDKKEKKEKKDSRKEAKEGKKDKKDKKKNAE
ncbi:AGD5, partial [Symbiodinium necroappetens]